MSTNLKRTVSNQQNELYKKQLKDIMKMPGNSECVDCGVSGPRWASVNLGIFMYVNRVMIGSSLRKREKATLRVAKECPAECHTTTDPARRLIFRTRTQVLAVQRNSSGHGGAHQSGPVDDA